MRGRFVILLCGLGVASLVGCRTVLHASGRQCSYDCNCAPEEVCSHGNGSFLCQGLGQREWYRCVPKPCFAAGDVEQRYPERSPYVEFDPVSFNALPSRIGHDGGVCNSWGRPKKPLPVIHASGLLCVSDCTCPESEYCVSSISKTSCEFSASNFMRCVPRQCQRLELDAEPDDSVPAQRTGLVVFDTHLVPGTPRAPDGGTCTEFPKAWLHEVRDAGRMPLDIRQQPDFEGLPL